MAVTGWDTVPVVHCGGTSFLSRLDILEAVREGANRISVKGCDLNGPEWLVAITVCRSTDPEAPLTTVEILDGAESGSFPLRPPWARQRTGDVRIHAGALREPPREPPPRHRGRRARPGGEIFLFTAIVDRTHRLVRKDFPPAGNDRADTKGRREALAGARGLGGDRLGLMRNCRCRGADVALFAKPCTVPRDSSFAAFQVQSEDPENGDSFAVYFAANELPYVECPHPVPDIRVTKDVYPKVLPEPGGRCTSP